MHYKLRKRIEDLSFKVKRFVAKRYQDSLKAKELLKHITIEHVNASFSMIDGFRKMNVNDNDGIILGMRNRLPQTVQRHYDCAFSHLHHQVNNCIDAEGATPSRFKDPPPRWSHDHWTCRCGVSHTLWYKTHLRYNDRYQIYCASCKMLAGWGTKHEYETAFTSGVGKPLMITHPLDRDAYQPPPLIPPRDQSVQNRIRAKQSQTRLQSSLRQD